MKANIGFLPLQLLMRPEPYVLARAGPSRQRGRSPVSPESRSFGRGDFARAQGHYNALGPWQPPAPNRRGLLDVRSPK
jgi:hypothetical protein